MNRLVRYGLVALFLALAPLLLVQAGANADPPSGPMRDLNGYNLATMARAGLLVEQRAGTTRVVVDEAALDLARRAFAREPLASDALFMLAVDERARVRGDSAQELLTLASGLDRRNRYLNALQVEQAVRQGDFPRMSARLDEMARIQPALTGEFVQPLVAALQQESVLPAVRTILADEPAWAEAFWLAVPGDARLVERFYQLRQMTDRGTTAQSDARLLAALATSGRYDDAFAFRAQLGLGGSGIGFVPAGGTAPFGWAAETSAERSMNPRGEAGYEVFVQQGTSGELARQLLRLPPGSYSFTARVTPVSAAESLSVRLKCADNDALEVGPRTLDAAASLAVPGTCRNWWLVLEGTAWQTRGGLRAEIADMRFAPAQ